MTRVTYVQALEEHGCQDSILVSIRYAGCRTGWSHEWNVADGPGTNPHILRGENGESTVHFVHVGALEPGLFEKLFQVLVARIQNRSGTTGIELKEDVPVS
jgi:hypothetical protein